MHISERVGKRRGKRKLKFRRASLLQLLIDLAKIIQAARIARYITQNSVLKSTQMIRGGHFHGVCMYYCMI